MLKGARMSAVRSPLRPFGQLVGTSWQQKIHEKVKKDWDHHNPLWEIELVGTFNHMKSKTGEHVTRLFFVALLEFVVPTSRYTRAQVWTVIELLLAAGEGGVTAGHLRKNLHPIDDHRRDLKLILKLIEKCDNDCLMTTKDLIEKVHVRTAFFLLRSDCSLI